MTSTAVAFGSVLTASGLFLRRRISKNWITSSAITSCQLTNDQTIIITGGNTGLGYEAAKKLSTYGAKIILACRDVESGKRATVSIRESTSNNNIECMHLDLASLKSVRTFATKLKARNDMDAES